RLLDLHGHLQGQAGSRRDVRARHRPVGGLEEGDVEWQSRADTTDCSSYVASGALSALLGRRMISLIPRLPLDRPARVLCLGAHADDIEIGCGGTMLALTERLRHVAVDWVVFSATPVREREARASADTFLAAAKEKTIVVHAFRDGFFPYKGGEIKQE